VAWVLIVGGAGVATLGLVLLIRFGLGILGGELMKDLAGWGSIDLRDVQPAKLRRSLKELWKENPRLAAQADESLRSFDEMRQKDPGALDKIEFFYRFMYVARYVAIAMVVLGVAAVAGGIWLR
jgi:hypothetical protein